MAATPPRQRSRAHLPPCYYEGYLEKRAHKDKVYQRLWTCLCGNALYFFSSTRDTAYSEKLDLSGFISLADDGSRDRNLEAARLSLRLRDGEVKLMAPSLEARELWKGFIYAVAQLSVPSSLNLLPGQIHLLKEVVERERQRRRPAVPLYLPLVGEIPPCFQPVSRTEAELLLERHPDCGNLLLRPGRDGSSLAVTTRQDLHGSVFRHYRITQRPSGGYLIDVENPIPCATLHDVIECLVEKTSGTLQPFLLEQPYEENITFVKSDDESGERSLERCWSPPSRVPPLPPRHGDVPEESIYLNDSCVSPRASPVPPDHAPDLPPKPGKKSHSPRNTPSPKLVCRERRGSGSGRDRSVKPPPVPPLPRQLSHAADSLAQAISEELKLKLEKRRTNQQ